MSVPLRRPSFLAEAPSLRRSKQVDAAAASNRRLLVSLWICKICFAVEVEVEVEVETAMSGVSRKRMAMAIA